MLPSRIMSTFLFVYAQGRIHQIEYAMEAVKQGSATVGLKSKTHAVLVALKVQHDVCCQSQYEGSRQLLVIFSAYVHFGLLQTLNVTIFIKYLNA